MDITTLTLVHTIISIVAIAAGLVVVGGLIAGVRIDGWTGIFLVTTALTSITGFFFPLTPFLASHWIGVISLLILPFVIAARYWKHLRGGWRGIRGTEARAARKSSTGQVEYRRSRHGQCTP